MRHAHAIPIDELELGVFKRIPEEYRGHVMLWWATLNQALVDAAHYMDRKGTNKYPDRDHVRGYEWVFSDNEGVPSFLWVCATLGLEPGVVRLKFNANWRNFLTSQPKKER